MRRRLVLAFVGLTVVVVAAYGIPRAYLLEDLVRGFEQTRLDRTAPLVARAVQGLATDGSVTRGELDGLAASDEVLTASLPDGEVVTSSGSGREVEVRASAPLEGGGSVTVGRTRAAVQAEISRAVLPLALLGVVLAALAALGGLLLARRLSMPFSELAGTARGLGEGQLHPESHDYDIPEAREIERALVEAGARVDALLSQERQVAVHASHELRTPVTALRLELESLATWDQTPTTIADELRRCVGELDRLEGAITGLLTLSAHHRAASEVEVDLDEVVRQVARRRSETGFEVVQQPCGDARTRLDLVAVRRALDLLLDELRAEGADRVALRVEPRDSHLVLGLSASPASWATGRDGRDGTASDRWERANELVASVGGHLHRSEGTVLVRLPRRLPLEGHLPAH